MLKTLSAASRPLGARAFSSAGKEKIAMVGSGNFGSALMRILGRNATRHDVFDDEVRMYVHEEMIDGKPLTEIINTTNENVKYLPGAKFTPNVVADPKIESAVAGATMICFCLPHQFLKPMVPAIKVRRRLARAPCITTCTSLALYLMRALTVVAVRPRCAPGSQAAAAPGVKCLSAIKGIDFDENGIVLISDIIRRELGADCSVLMGANVANDMAADAFCETTIGYKVRAMLLAPPSALHASDISPLARGLAHDS
jgi:glycerol-3-phosphate dehydrogenase (NAD+)